MLEQYFSEIDAYELIDREEERRLLTEAKAGNKIASEKLINSNLKFVVSVAKSYQGQGIPLEDLISEGNLGLIKALDKFDLNREVKFISYAVWWIRQSIINAIHENAKIVRLPLNKINNLTKAKKARNELEEILGREASLQELENYIDNPEIIRDMKFNFEVISVNKPHTNDNKDLTTVISYDDKESPEHYEKEFRKELNFAIRGFTPREKKIIKMYYGIGYVRPYTLKEIGEEMNLTRERIRQIKERALQKLRKKHRNETLGLYL
jgi:RNA polymerase primary sigma factor